MSEKISEYDQDYDDGYEDGVSDGAEVMLLGLRDTFAAHALTGMLAGRIKPELTQDDVADYAYRYADALLRAREGEADAG